jgi:CRISPR-associated protein Cas5t
MLGTYVTVPVAGFRMAYAREYWETHPLPPPSTCYGFLLSLVGETDRGRHIGCRVTAARLDEPDLSVVLRTLWRIKSKNLPPGVGNNKTPGHQQLLTGTKLVIWLDSSEEVGEKPDLESRVRRALDPASRGQVNRFGGLSLGESTHLVDQVCRFPGDPNRRGLAFLLAQKGQLTLPVWVDHVGSAGTRFVTGNLEQVPLEPPELARMPRIIPKDNSR